MASPPTIPVILAGAITIVNAEPSDAWDRDTFISLLAQLAYCPAAPPPPSQSKSPVPVASSSPPTAPAVDRGIHRSRSTTVPGKGLKYHHHNLPPTPPMSPVVGLEQQQQQQSKPLPFATCLTLNRSHSISAPGFEVATAYAKRHNVPRESVLLVGAAQVLASYYVGQRRRGVDGNVKAKGVVAGMEGCIGCGCLDFNRRRGSNSVLSADGELVEMGAEDLEEGKKCQCGHERDMHEAWAYVAPPAPPAPAPTPAPAPKAVPAQESRGRSTGSRKQGKVGGNEDTFAQTADDSNLFETDVETDTDNNYNTHDEEDEEDEDYDNFQDSSSIRAPSPSGSIATLAPYRPRQLSPACLLPTLPTAPSPGLYQLLKRFCYWSVWSYRDLSHRSSSGRRKKCFSEVRACSECNCADFYLESGHAVRMMRLRRVGSKDSLRSVRSFAREGPSGLGSSGGGLRDGYIAGGGGYGSQRRDRRDSRSSVISSTASVYHYPTHAGSTASLVSNLPSSSANARSATPQLRKRGSKRFSMTALDGAVGSRSATPTPLSMASTGTGAPMTTIPSPTFSIASNSTIATTAGTRYSRPHRAHRSSGHGARADPYDDDDTSSVMSMSMSISGHSTTSRAGDRERGERPDSYPEAPCECGHASEAHVRQEGGHDLSWILVEWAYNALAHLGGQGGGMGNGGDGMGDGDGLVGHYYALHVEEVYE